MALLVFVHVLISLIGIVTGLAVAYGWVTVKRLPGWTAAFLVSTILTSATGFILPFERFLPSHAFGILSLIVLAIAVFALYRQRLAGWWRAAYLISAALALYLNIFVLIVQMFLKIPALNALAPTQSEPPFLIAQLGNLVAFLALTACAVARYRPTPLEASLNNLPA